MITDVLSLNTGKQTTAQRVIDYFRDRNIKIFNLDGDKLLPLYQSLNRSSYTAQGRPSNFSHLDATTSTVVDKVWGVIVETRRHHALEHVVQQFSTRLGIGVQLFHGTANEVFIKESSISKLVEEGKVVLTALQVEALPPADYNSLLLSSHFWSAVKGRKKILIFQTDAMICQSSDYSLEDFLMFDYIGANWSRERSIGMTIDGGVGGLSLRDWSKTMECLTRFDARQWPGGEDGYFAFHMELLGGRVAKPQEFSRFGTQTEFLERSFGAHKITELDAESLGRFLDYCPEARLLFRKEEFSSG